MGPDVQDIAKWNIWPIMERSRSWGKSWEKQFIYIFSNDIFGPNFIEINQPPNINKPITSTKRT